MKDYSYISLLFMDNSPTTQPTQSLSLVKIKLYPSQQYAFIGFLLTMLPVFIMSLSNAGKIPNAAGYRKKISVLFAIWIAGIIACIGLTYYQIYAFSASAERYIESLSATQRVLFMQTGSMNDIDAMMRRAENVIQGLMYVEIIFNLVILLLAARLANKHERTVIDEMKQRGEAEERSVMPMIIVGILFSVLLWVGNLMLSKRVVSDAISRLSEGVQHQVPAARTSLDAQGSAVSAADRGPAAAVPADLNSATSAGLAEKNSIGAATSTDCAMYGQAAKEYVNGAYTTEGQTPVSYKLCADQIGCTLKVTVAFSDPQFEWKETTRFQEFPVTGFRQPIDIRLAQNSTPASAEEYQKKVLITEKFYNCK